ncbi:5-oxoprolinase subunit PxpB [Caldalkalibacillus salinus]|uniref:5-oxoprolinase subunit PxpB n=1 Tax=Caldalkalibacillus salinus TaxID=2803787 RepID=UPI001921BABD|nr:5-oxoprolinase subunit PxpB [Caldalkalibacillus salinus]
MLDLKFKPLGDHGVSVIFGHHISQRVSVHIRRLKDTLEHRHELPILECVPGYTTLAIYYDATRWDYESCVQMIRELSSDAYDQTDIQPEVIEIPVLYDPEVGPDLIEVARHHQLSVEDVIHIHTSVPYFIYMLGFSPGFPYLGGMSQHIATPRLANPRPHVEAGSVGIAGEQTGIYSIDSPGGWRIIGQTPLRLYDPDADHPFLLEAGHYVRFIPISKQRFYDLKEHIALGGKVNINRYPMRQMRE